MESVSVLIVTHNRAQWIAETVRSVLDQSIQNFELIIIDDGSTDNTEEIIADFKDQRINYFKYPRIGVLPKLRNIAVSKSTKPYLAFIDSDDLWGNQKLEKCLNICLENESEICLADCQEFNTNGFVGQSRGIAFKNKTDVNIRHEILIRNLPLTYGSNFFISRSAYNAVGGFDESLFHGDHDFICRALYTSKGSYYPEALSFIRRHETNMSDSKKNLDLSSLEEYSLTLKKLWKKNTISDKEFHFVTSSNYYRMALFALSHQQFRVSFEHFKRSLKHQFKLRRIVKYMSLFIYSVFHN